MRSRFFVATLWLASLVLVSAGSATAVTLITGKQIKDGSLTTKDLKNGGVAWVDLGDGVKSYMSNAYDMIATGTVRISNGSPAVVKNSSWSLAGTMKVARTGVGQYSLTVPKLSTTPNVLTTVQSDGATMSTARPNGSLIIIRTFAADGSQRDLAEGEAVSFALS